MSCGILFTAISPCFSRFLPCFSRFSPCFSRLLPCFSRLLPCSDVTRYLQLLLRREGHVFKTSAEFEVVRTIKVRTGVATSTAGVDLLIPHAQEQLCYVSINPTKDEQLDDRSTQARYVLPDRNEITVKLRAQCPCTLWHPPTATHTPTHIIY
jgi:hypothetical protein